MIRVALALVLVLLAPLAAAAEGPSLDKADLDLAAPARAVAAAAQATGDAAAGAAKGAAHAVGAIAGAIGGALAAVGKGLLGAALALGSLVGALLSSGARFVASHPQESAVVAGSAGALATLYALARKYGALVLVPLYSRLAPSQMLDNEVRQRVYEHVKANPAAHPSAIAEMLGLGWGTVVYHLARLEESRLLTHRVAANRKCYFALGADLDAAARDAVAATSTDKAKAIVAALRAQPELSQKDLAERLGMSQALASWHVKRLVASGVLTTRRSGRANLLAVAAHVPVTA